MSYPDNTGQILKHAYPDLDPTVDYEVSQGSDGTIQLSWITTEYPKPSVAEVLALEKSWAASVKQAEIHTEQELRSTTILGFQMPAQGFAIMEELYLAILLPASRNAITENDTPIWYGLKQLRDNRNTLLANLQVWIDDALKTADDILSFEVETWSGWDVARP